MQNSVIETWINEVAESNPSPSLKRKRDSETDYPSPMSSPTRGPKRPLTVPIDLDATPRAPQDPNVIQFRKAASSFAENLKNAGESPSAKRRRQSPSKKHYTTASLMKLNPPIHVIQTQGLLVIPKSIRGLYTELFRIAKQASILPPNIKRIMTSEAVENLMILPHNWEQDDDPENDARIEKEHALILDILEEAEEAQTLMKGESAWNAQVHYPILKLAFSQFPSLRPETITSAQIVKDFRPRSNSLSSSASSSAASSRSSLLSGDSGTWTEPESSVHKMVDFALALIPDDTLQVTIDNFLKTQWHDTINQTACTALASRPAPLFIETKTTSGAENRSQAQLGIWVAAWYQRLRAAKSTKDSIPIPLLQVYGNVWHVIFATDEKDKITIIDQVIRIGDTASIVGMYQLLTALRVIGKWANTEFRTWIGDFLENIQIQIPSQSQEGIST
ncbi:methyltransferase type 11 [Fusarium mundagurra]|uniref:Methyltransferase type 11 n=1 Tax=Fusarium mundagurra TaxID=1567541 RepID=A0A8H6D5T7_9HYPO|nr:methyltransferase type 11 [Fusarium mundagurra]